MTEPQKHDWPKIIAEIVAANFSLYKIATRLGKQYIQVKRIKDTGRCQHSDGERLLAIHAEVVPRETLQNVPASQANLMRPA